MKAVSDLWKVTVVGDISAEQNICNKHCFINSFLTRPVHCFCCYAFLFHIKIDAQFAKYFHLYLN